MEALLACAYRGFAREQTERDHVLLSVLAAHVGAQDRLARESGSLGDPLRGDVAGRGQQVDPLESERAEAPRADQADRAGGVPRPAGRGAPASSRPRPGGAPSRAASARSSRAARCSGGVHDRERRGRAGEDRVVALQQVRAGVGLAVVVGHPRPADDLGVAAGLDQRRRGRSPATGAGRSTPSSSGSLGRTIRVTRASALGARARPAAPRRRGPGPARASHRSASRRPPSAAQPALAVLGDEVGERVHAPRAEAPGREIERRPVRVERVHELARFPSRGATRTPRRTGGRRRARAIAAPRSGRRPRGVATRPRSAFVTTSTSGTSMIPAFRNWSTSPEAGWTTTATVSATSATSVSDCPTPTVSITTTSNARRQRGGRGAGRGSQAPEAVTGGGRADEHAAIGRVDLDPGAVAEQRAAGAPRGRIDRQHRDRAIAARATPRSAARAARTCRRRADR